VGVKERKLREKLDREQSILAAAKRVFLQKGLAAATIVDIVAEAELGKGTFYQHYRSKEEIMLAMSEQAFRELHEHYVAAVAVGGTALDKILRTTRTYYEFAMANPAYFSFIAFFESPYMSTMMPEQLVNILTTIHGLMRGLRDEGLADGSVRQDLDADLVANTVWGTSFGMVQFIVSKSSYMLQDQYNDTDKQFDTYLAMLESSLRAPTTGR